MSRKSIQIEYDGVVYDSIADAARAAGKAPRTFYKRRYLDSLKAKSEPGRQSEAAAQSEKVYQDILDAILRYVAIHKRPPTFNDVSDGIKYAGGGAIWARMVYLREHGYIDWQEGLARTIQVLKPVYEGGE